MAVADPASMGCRPAIQKAALRVTVIHGVLLEAYVMQIRASALVNHQLKDYDVINVKMGFIALSAAVVKPVDVTLMEQIQVS